MPEPDAPKPDATAVVATPPPAPPVEPAPSILADAAVVAEANAEIDAKNAAAATPPPAPTPEPVTAPAPDPVPAPEPVAQDTGSVKLIHFVEDGFTAFGQIWYKGQELEIKIPSGDYENTKDINGFSWLSMSEPDQLDRYDKVMWREGPWTGRGYSAAVFEGAAPPAESLAAAEQAEAARRRQPPPVNQ